MKARESLLRLIFLVIIFELFLHCLSFGQCPSANEALTLFTRDSVFRFLDTTRTCAKYPDSVLVSSANVESVLVRWGALSICKAFHTASADTLDSVFTDNTWIRFKKLPLKRVFRIFFPFGDSVQYQEFREAVDELNALAEVGSVEQNCDGHMFEAAGDTSNDARWREQWALLNTGQSGGTPGADIRATEAWSIFKGDSSIKIGIVDFGVNGAHEDLAAKIQGNFTSGPHGTGIAGIAAATTNNGMGIAGIDWKARILDAPIVDGEDLRAGVNAVMDAVSRGAHVFTNSWATLNVRRPITPNVFHPDFPTVLRSAFGYAYKKDRAAVAAMMNDAQAIVPNPVRYPAGFEHGVIAVGASTDADDRAQFSNTGRHIDVVAPGGIDFNGGNPKNILCPTWPGNNAYIFETGTSFAVPHVAGLAALLKGYDNFLSNDDIQNLIQKTSDDRGPAGWDSSFGYGRINARRALEKANCLVVQHYTAAGGTVSGSTDTLRDFKFFTVIGIPNDGARFKVILDTVTTTVAFDTSLGLVDTVWGRGVGTKGFSTESPNHGMGFCDVKTFSSTGATLRTYVYRVFNPDGTLKGTFPAQPQDVVFAYTVLRKTGPVVTANDNSVPDRTILTWPDGWSCEDGFKIYRSPNAGSTWDSTAQVASNVTTFTDSTRLGSKTYKWRVSPFKGVAVDTGQPSIQVTTKPIRPQNFQASVTTFCFGFGSGMPEAMVTDTGQGLSLPCELVGTNQVVVTWQRPTNQNPLDSIKEYVIRARRAPSFEVEQEHVLSASRKADTLNCLELNTLYRIEGHSRDQTNDSSVVTGQQVVTGPRQLCAGSDPKPVTPPALQSQTFSWSLFQNHPNPFNPETDIRYSLAQEAQVSLAIYNLLGQKVRELVNAQQPAGIYTAHWDGKDELGRPVGSGIYFARLVVGEFVDTKRMLLVK